MTAFETFSRAELAVLAREYLLAGHLIDRAGMPYVVRDFGRDAMRDIAIDEWMGASPIYTRRIRAALGIEGDDVATIFKGMQFDIGAPHQFMDFRFTVHDERRGEFSLASCGALLDVEPLGESFVVAMCHHIEDPTFDATASATNPRARMRPVHRPPRVPAGRLPHCNWTVEIDPANEPLPEPEVARRLASSKAATTELATPGAGPESGGTSDYADAFDPDLQFERFSHPTLVRLLEELALQGHLLARSFMLAVRQRFGTEAALRLGAHQLTGIAGLTAKRLARVLGVAGGAAGVARILELHPAFHPRAYVDVRIESGDEVLVTLLPCDALDEGDDFTWPALLARHGCEAISTIAATVDVGFQGKRVTPTGKAVGAWAISAIPAGTEAPVAEEVAVASFSKGAAFEFEDRAR